MIVNIVCDPKTLLSTKREQLFSIVVAFCIGVAVWAEVGFPWCSSWAYPSIEVSHDDKIIVVWYWVNCAR